MGTNSISGYTFRISRETQCFTPYPLRIREERIMNLHELKNFAREIRRLGLKMAIKAAPQASHLGGSMSCAEIIATLYGHAANVSKSSTRDRIIISKAHAILAHLPALHLLGFFPEEWLYTAYEDGGVLVCRPRKPELGLEFSGGSLGMGVCLAVGMAITAKHDRMTHRVYTLLGDGECNEGSVWEALTAAKKFALDNLTVIIDRNGLQYDGFTDDIMPMNIEAILHALDFTVESVNGHDIEALCAAFDSAHDGKPKAIVAHTIKGKGVSRFENNVDSHHTAITQADYDEALARLEAEDND